MGIASLLAQSSREVIRLQCGDEPVWFDYELAPIDKGVVLTNRRASAFALHELTRGMGKASPAAELKQPDPETMDEDELRAAVENWMQLYRQISPNTLKDGAERTASVVCLGVRRVRAWYHDHQLTDDGSGPRPRVDPHQEDPEVQWEGLEVALHERMRDPENGVIWVNDLPPSHIQPLHDAIFALSSEDAARIASFRRGG